MKKILLTMLFALAMITAGAQSKYISYTPDETKNVHNEDLAGNGGFLILSERSDLVVSVTNSPTAKITPLGKRSDGLYAYEVVVNRSQQRTPRVEVSKRGDIDRVDFAKSIRPNTLHAYIIQEVDNPIRMEDQTSGNDVILDAKLAEVEISTTINDLKVDCPKELGATVTTSRKASDQSVFITSVKIPVAKLKEAKDNLDALRQKAKELDDITNKTDAVWSQMDANDAALSDAAKLWQRISVIEVYAPETNRLPIDIGELGPRMKKCYGVLPLVKVVRDAASEFLSFMDTGAQSFNLRKYDDAKRAFSNALKAKDMPADMAPVVNSNIAQCDTCLLYERFAGGAVLKLVELRKSSETASQRQVAEYAVAASEFLGVCYKYNPCDFYKERIDKLDQLVAEMPLELRFTIAKWVSNRVSVYEDGYLPNVEVWAYYGSTQPSFASYANDNAFKKMVNASSDFRLLGTSDENGIVDLEVSRGKLPTGLFFHPVDYKNRVRPAYKDMTEIMSSSVGDYMKRQFRMKMYTRK